MISKGIPAKMRAWQYKKSGGPLDENLSVNSAAALPQIRADCHLVRVLATSLNPVDYKLAEIGLISRVAISKPACPGLDVAGRIVTPAVGSTLKSGQLVFGNPPAKDLMAGRGLAEYTLLSVGGSVPIPSGVTPVEAASIPIAGLTAWQTIVDHVKPGARVFINGGSGGVGTFGIQIAKLHGCHVTCSCSTSNIELCKSLGADEVIDYKKGPVIDAIKAMAKDQKQFDHVIDYVGSDYDLFWKCHEYTVPAARFVSIAATPSWSFALFALQASLWPGFLGGSKRTMQFMFGVPNTDQLTQIATWISEGKIRAVIDENFTFEQAVQAVRKMKTGRAKGKIVVGGTPEMEED